MFPFVTVVECPEAKLLEAMGPTLVCTAITEKPELRRAFLDATHIDRLNLGPVPDHPAQLAPAARRQHRRFPVPAARVAERQHVKILFITAGAAGMYCGSCLRDNALAAELKSRGHDVLLVPLYTPTLTDEPNVSEGRVFFGGVSVYLQQKASFFRWAPRIFDKLLDAPWLVKAASSGSISTDPRSLGELTISMLKGKTDSSERNSRRCSSGS